MQNIEIKTRVPELLPIRQAAQSLATDSLPTMRQVDTYFRTERGRLKLRVIDDQSAELIWYERADESSAKLSQYWITPIADWHSLEKSLAGAWGLRTVVDKRREVFFWNNVRIHLDQVVDLGVFVELEAVLSDTISEEEGRRQADFLCTQLELPLSGLLKESYVDLKLAREA